MEDGDGEGQHKSKPLFRFLRGWRGVGEARDRRRIRGRRGRGENGKRYDCISCYWCVVDMLLWF